MNAIDLLQTGVLVFLLVMAVVYVISKRPIVPQKESDVQEAMVRLTAQLAEANQKIGHLETVVTELQAKIKHYEQKLDIYEGERTRNPILLVVVGAEPMLKADLTVLRSVEQRTPLKIKRVTPATKVEFARWLDNARMNGAPIRYVHIATHAGPQGVKFADGLVDAAWLSEQMRGVDVLVLNGCETSGIGELLQLVPTVVTTHEALDNNDAWKFAVTFWQAIGEGLALPAVEQRCRDRLPIGIMEYVEIRSWA